MRIVASNFRIQKFKTTRILASLLVATITPWQSARANNLLDTVRGYLGNGSQYGAPPNQGYSNDRYNDRYSYNNDPYSYNNDERGRERRNERGQGTFTQELTAANLDQRIEQLRSETNAARYSGRISNNQAGAINERLARLRGALRSTNDRQLSFGDAQGMVNELNGIESGLQASANSSGQNQLNNRWAGRANNGRDYR